MVWLLWLRTVNIDSQACEQNTLPLYNVERDDVDDDDDDGPMWWPNQNTHGRNVFERERKIRER